MSQNVVDYSLNPTGPELMDDFLAKEQENNLTLNMGVVRPSYAKAGTMWIDNSVTPWVLKLFDGTDDIVIGEIKSTFLPSVLKNDDNSKVDYVLTAGSVGTNPTYQKNPIGIYIYSVSKKYNLNDVVIEVTADGFNLYKSLSDDNVGNPLTDQTKWEAGSLGGVEKIINISNTSGEVSLNANNVYTMTISDTTTFSCNLTKNVDVFQQIKLIAYVSGNPTINWGTNYFFNGETPEISTGYYDIYFDYDPKKSSWVVGVIAKGTV